MKRLLLAMALCVPVLTGAQGQRGEQPPFPGAYGEERPPLEQLHAIPYTYVGGSGRVSLTIDDEGDSTGELMRIFDNTGEHAYIGQIWWGDGGAGGLQLGYNWLWGGISLSEAKEDPSRVTVARTLFAIDQNMFKDRRITLGFGIERPNFFFDTYLSAAASGSRDGGQRQEMLTNFLTGVDDTGHYRQSETTTVLEEFATAPYDYGLGMRLGRYSDRMALRFYSGLDYLRGDGGAHILTASLGADKYLGRRGWSLSGQVEHDQSSTDPLLGTSSDTRVQLALRYEFGGRVFAPTSEVATPAWIARAMVNPPTSRPRVVQTYTRRTKTTTTTELGDKQYTNLHPVAMDDLATLVEGSAGVWIDVLANDTDADGDTITLVSATAPMHGTANISDGRIYYSPHAGFVGSDSFSYSITDGRGGTGGANVYITVSERPNQAPVARDDSATTEYNTAVTLSPLANDSDPDGDTLRIVSITQPVNGRAVLDGEQVTYTPRSDFFGTDSFTYSIEDGRDGSAVGTITITVLAPPNRPPQARDDVASTTINTSVAVSPLANDSDPDGDTLRITNITQPSNGRATLSGDQVTYTPNNGFIGSDAFSYSITDGRGGSATATITITVQASPNNPPLAVNDNASTTINTPVAVSPLANDSDPDGDTLSITSITQPANGRAVLNGDEVTYTPNNGFIGTDVFSYNITDGRGGSAGATITIRVQASSNNPPLAQPDSANTPTNMPITLSPLVNDSDPDGDTLSITSITQPSNGTAVLNGNQVTYTANPGFVGTDSFDYEISDGRGGTASATITITVQPVPVVANNDGDFSGSGAGRISVRFNNTVIIDVLANDSNPGGYPLTVTVGQSPAMGSVTVDGNNRIHYTWTTATAAPPSFDEFTYTISTAHGGTATAMVRVHLLPNSPPMAVNDVLPPRPFGIPVNIDPLVNDSDPDGDALSIFTAAVQVGGGTIEINSSRDQIRYTPGTYTGTAVIEYTITDGNGGFATAQITINVLPNNPPVVNQPIISLNIQTSGAIVNINGIIDVLAVCSDPDGHAMVITDVLSLPAPYSYSIEMGPNGRQVLRVLGPISTGQQIRFGYQIADEHGMPGTNSGIVVITGI